MSKGGALRLTCTSPACVACSPAAARDTGRPLVGQPSSLPPRVACCYLSLAGGFLSRRFLLR